MSQQTHQQPHNSAKSTQRVEGLQRYIANGLTLYEQTPEHDALIAASYFRMVDEGSALNVIPDGTLSSLMVAIRTPLRSAACTSSCTAAR